MDLKDWNNGKFSCTQDFNECFCAYFCTICYLRQIIKRADEGYGAILCCGLVPLRTKIRIQRKIEGTICGDFFSLLFCPQCSLVQMGMEARDIESLI